MCIRDRLELLLFFVSKNMTIFYLFFFKKLNFGLMVWTICVTPELSDIGGSESIIWSTPSSNGLVIGPLLASGGRKNLFLRLAWVLGITTFISIFDFSDSNGSNWIDVCMIWARSHSLFRFSTFLIQMKVTKLMFVWYEEVNFHCFDFRLFWFEWK